MSPYLVLTLDTSAIAAGECAVVRAPTGDHFVKLAPALASSMEHRYRAYVKFVDDEERPLGEDSILQRPASTASSGTAARRVPANPVARLGCNPEDLRDGAQ